jgi:hypothetical protein
VLIGRREVWQETSLCKAKGKVDDGVCRPAVVPSEVGALE